MSTGHELLDYRWCDPEQIPFDLTLTDQKAIAFARLAREEESAEDDDWNK